MRAELIGPHDDRWTSFLERVEHDFYHLPKYVEVSARQDHGEPRAMLVEDGDRQLLLPLIVRPIQGSAALDATSPYGYPGTLLTRTDDRAFERDALLAAAASLADLGVVSVFVRLHPLLNADPPRDVGTVVTHGQTVTVDLRLPPETLWSQTRRNHRQQIMQAIRAGFTPSVDERWAHFEGFKRLYRNTMEHRAASAYYFFDDAYFDGLRAALDGRIHLAVVTLDGEVAAAGLFVETRGLVQMHLTGHDDRFSAFQPMKLLFHHVREWTRQRGDRLLHLGGGRGGCDDSLYHFKAGFSPLRQPFCSLRMVTRDLEYRVLVTRAQKELNPADLSGSFPLYRR